MAYDFPLAPSYAPLYLPIAYIAELSAPPVNPGLELTQTTVAGCKNVTGRVNISSPAPAGGLVVNLSDTLSSASTPASLTIPAGATSKSFLITTRPVFGMQTGTVSATFGGKTFRSPQLIVRPMGLQSVLLGAHRRPRHQADRNCETGVQGGAGAGYGAPWKQPPGDCVSCRRGYRDTTGGAI